MYKRQLQGGVDRSLLTLRQRYNDAIQSLDSEALKLLREWPARLKSIVEPVNEYQVRDKTIRVENYRESLSHQQIPKIAAPTYKAVSYTHLDVYKRQVTTSTTRCRSWAWG